MKPVGNIARFLDLTKPVTSEQVTKAMARAKAEQRGMTLEKTLAAGYEVQYLRPTLIANTCAAMFGHQYRPIPTIVKSH